MNIKQAAEQSGVSSPNIRFYEKEGLMTPARNRGNAYRDYTAGDIRTLKLIRMLRMLDMPLPTIKAVLRGEQPLQQALQAQQTVLAGGTAGGCDPLLRRADPTDSSGGSAGCGRLPETDAGPAGAGQIFLRLAQGLPYRGRKRTEKTLFHRIGTVHQYPGGFCSRAAALWGSSREPRLHHKRGNVPGV